MPESLQTRAWILAREQAHGVRVAQLADKDFATVLEACCQDGRWDACVWERARMEQLSLGRGALQLGGRVLRLAGCALARANPCRHGRMHPSTGLARPCRPIPRHHACLRPLLVENMDELLDPVLDPFLEKTFVTRGEDE